MLIMYVFLHVEMKKKILIQVMVCFMVSCCPPAFFQTKAFEIRMDTF